MPFELHQRLAAGGHDFGKLGISRVLLKNNAVFPWFVLVPEVDDESIVDLDQLSEADFQSVTSATRELAGFLRAHFPQITKVNVGAIGNQVPQLHIHLVGRHPEDPAWPATVWAPIDKRPYSDEEVAEIRRAYQAHFG